MDKIVVLDGHTLNPGDLDWTPVEVLGDLTVYPRTSPDEVVARANGAGLILTNKVPLGKTELDRLPDLRYIGVLATGYNIVDVPEAARRGIIVTNVPEYSTRSVAQLTFGLILELAHHVGAHSERAKGGAWASSIDFSFWDFPLVELEGLTLGIVGYGRIGRAVAAVAKAFGMNVVANNPGREMADVPLLGLNELLAVSDVVSLHCPLTATNANLICRETLARMKPTAWLVNTARGPLVNEKDLAEALSNGTIAGAAVDVLSVEPPPSGNPLLSEPNCIVTPHIAWATFAARKRLMSTVASNIRAFLQGHPDNVVGVS